jgi:hypothetical protein
MVFSGSREISWLIRETLEVCNDYNCAYEKLKSEKIAALGYIILAGVNENEGVIITRNKLSVAHEEHLNNT